MKFLKLLITSLMFVGVGIFANAQVSSEDDTYVQDESWVEEAVPYSPYEEESSFPYDGEMMDPYAAEDPAYPFEDEEPYYPYEEESSFPVEGEEYYDYEVIDEDPLFDEPLFEEPIESEDISY